MQTNLPVPVRLPNQEAKGTGDLRRAFSGYRLGLWGLGASGRRRVHAAVDRLAAAKAPAAERGIALLAAGELARRASAWDEASGHYSAAFELLSEAGLSAAASTSLALAVDSRSLVKGLDDGRRFLDEVDGRGLGSTALAHAVLQLARGQTQEARGTLKDLLMEPQDPFARWWQHLVTAETLLEMGALVGAKQALAKVRGELPHELRFTETSLRLLWLEAWSEVARLAAKPAVEALDDDELRVLLRRLRGYATNFPLYRAWAEQLTGEHALLLKENPAASFEAAAKEAELAGSDLLRAQLLARQVGMAHSIQDRWTAPRLHMARAMLVDVGAAGRVGSLGSGAKGGGVNWQNQPSRMSIALRLENDLGSMELDDEKGLEAVIEVSRYLQSIRDIDELLVKILDAVVRVMRAERGALLRVDADAMTCVAAHGLVPDDVTEGSNEISFGVIHEASASGETVLSGNALADERFMARASVMATDIRSVLCGPIRTRDKVLGYVYLDRRATGVPFDQGHQDLLSAFCVQVAVAWENALAFKQIESLNVGLEQKVKARTVELRERNDELKQTLDELTNTRLRLAEAQRDALETEMQLARDIQQSILPPENVLRHEGVEVCGLIIPASYCGGDFWYELDLGDGRTLIVVADVTGHGVAASLITAVARSCLDSIAAGEQTPSGLLQALNRVVWRSAQGKLCATAFVAIIDARAMTLRYANAGHNFPYVLSGGKVDPIVISGTRLGEAERYEASDGERALSKGDQLVLFTDGIVEWQDPRGREYGDRRMRKSLLAHAGEPVEQLIKSIIADAEAFADGTERDDDLTLAVVNLPG